MRCMAMVWRNEEFCYTQCRNKCSSGYQWCGTHMQRWDESSLVIRLDTKTREQHIKLAMQANAAAVRREQERAQREAYWAKVAEERKEQEMKQIFRPTPPPTETKRSKKTRADIWECQQCDNVIYTASMNGEAITPKQRQYILVLLVTRSLTESQKTRIINGLTTNDKAWASMTIHMLVSHEMPIRISNQNPY